MTIAALQIGDHVMRPATEVSTALQSVARLLVVFLMLPINSIAPQKGPQKPGSQPLVIEGQGSFYIGGRVKHTTATSGSQEDSSAMEDDIMVDQMYVQYQVPQNHGTRIPVVMVHGCCLSGKTWETTPDGRMGWSEYFLRRGRPVYIPDQTSRGRSGFDATAINQARLGTAAPGSIPQVFTVGRNEAWKSFRLGPEYPKPFPDEQFPVSAFDELAKQLIPDLNATLPKPNPTFANLAALGVLLKGAVLMGHSESGFFPERAALVDAAGVRGIISIEGYCPTKLPSGAVAVLARIPILLVFADHLSDIPEIPGARALADCRTFVRQVVDAGGDAMVLHLPEAGMKGNSHMLMQDLNNLQIADLILAWIDKHVERSR
ncbi:MAG: hypothetical protein ABR585_10620 [Gemmatimonadaceae bacterium]